MSEHNYPPPPPSGQVPPPQPQGQPQQQPQTIIVKQSSGTWWKLLLALCFLFVLGVGGCMALIGGVATEVDTINREAEQNRTTDEALIQDNSTITTCELSSFDTAKATVEFTNPLDEKKGWISIEVAFTNAENVVVGSGLVIFENLEAGQTARGEATAWDLASNTESVTCAVTDGSIL